MANQPNVPGVFITFEGGEGAGKTTHINFLADALRQQGRDVVCVREPGGTAIGEALRSIVLDDAHESMCAETELLIYEAARAQIVNEVIAPALERGSVVLCDRFCDSTVAYQGHGRGLSLEFVKRVNEFACQGVSPDRTVLMKTAGRASVGLRRATKLTGGDRIERAGVGFHDRVNRAFEGLAESDTERIRVVVSASRKRDTARAVFSAVADLFGWDPMDLPFDDEFFVQVEKRKKGLRPVEAADAAEAAAQAAAGRPC